MNNRKKINITKIIFALALFSLAAVSAFGQGSITGLVQNNNLTTPADSEIYFVGYIDDSDEEIRIESSTGAGYDIGNWYDDFQNYLTNNAGDPFDFHFFNIINNQAASVSGSTPSGSYHTGYDVQLAEEQLPAAPVRFRASLLMDNTIRISWNPQPGVSMRLYRRVAPSLGSLFRIDDPTGSLSNPGITDSVFIDTTVDNVNRYDYLLIPIETGLMGAHSEIISVHSDPSVFLCGDANGDTNVNLFDATFTIAYLYLGGPPPPDPSNSDINGTPGLNLFDVTYLIVYLYKGGPPPNCN